jgi:predicted esterase YcpF (UPF0227 family)
MIVLFNGKIFNMSDNTLHLRIKKEYAAALIEDLIKVHAIETVGEDEIIELTAQQKEALDKEQLAMASDPNYLQKWDDIKHRFKKP